MSVSCTYSEVQRGHYFQLHTPIRITYKTRSNVLRGNPNPNLLQQLQSYFYKGKSRPITKLTVRIVFVCPIIYLHTITHQVTQRATISHLKVRKYSHWTKVFTLYGHDSHLGHMTWILYWFPPSYIKFGFGWPSVFRCLNIMII